MYKSKKTSKRHIFGTVIYPIVKCIPLLKDY